MIFAKPEKTVQEIGHFIKESKTNEKPSYHSDIIIFKIDDFAVITGYKTPNTPSDVFKDQLTPVFNALASTPTLKQHILIGDFNTNMHVKPNFFLSWLKANSNMESKLPANESTTMYSTEIDVVFANFDNIVAGSYESYQKYCNQSQSIECTQRPNTICRTQIRKAAIATSMISTTTTSTTSTRSNNRSS